MLLFACQCPLFAHFFIYSQAKPVSVNGIGNVCPSSSSISLLLQLCCCFLFGLFGSLSGSFLAAASGKGFFTQQQHKQQQQYVCVPTSKPPSRLCLLRCQTLELTVCLKFISVSTLEEVGQLKLPPAFGGVTIIYGFECGYDASALPKHVL